LRKGSKKNFEEKSEDIIPFDPRDEYLWGMFQDEFDGKVYNTFEEMDKEVLPKMKRVFAIHKRGSNFYLTKEKDFCLTELPVKSFSSDIVVIKIRHGKDPKTKEDLFISVNLNMLVKRYGSTLSFYDATFEPYNIKEQMPKLGNKVLNKFPGFIGRYITDNTYDYVKKCEKVLWHIKNMICKKDEATEKWLTSFFATKFQNPRNKLGIALIVSSDGMQVAVKSYLFSDFLGDHVFGRRNFRTVESIKKDILGDFNAENEGKTFICIDDGKITTDDVMRMKNPITRNKAPIKEKYKATRDATDRIDYIILANPENLKDWKVSESEKRYVMIKASSEEQSQEYIRELRDDLSSQEVGDAFATYLMNYQCINLRPLLETEMKEEMVESSLPLPILFFKDIASEMVELHYPDPTGNPNVISSKNLVKCYREYESTNRKKDDPIYRDKELLNIMRRYIGPSSSRSIKGDKGLYYTIDLKGGYKTK